jgi:cysteine-rich repeat protein
MTCTSADACVGGICGGDSTTCGDGVWQAGCGEECDDGNQSSGDGCSATCRTELVCEPAPRVGCKRPVAPGAAKIRLMDKPTDASDALGWTWTKGAATSFAELGTPPTATDYLLCIYDDTRGLVMSAFAPADQSCAGTVCSSAAASGLKYKDKAATPDGLTALSLKIGAAGKSKITLKGKGPALPMPALPMGSTVTVQLRNGAGSCWEAVYGAPQRNDSTRYQAKSD